MLNAINSSDKRSKTNRKWIIVKGSTGDCREAEMFPRATEDDQNIGRGAVTAKVLLTKLI